jgi:hypothetical protein
MNISYTFYVKEVVLPAVQDIVDFFFGPQQRYE